MRVVFPAQIDPIHGSAILCRWASSRIDGLQTWENQSAALGVADDRGHIVGAVIFSNYNPNYRSIEIAAASETPRWLTAKVATAIMAYPFKQLGCGRVTAITPAGRTSASRFLEKFGFKREGLIRKGLGNQDAAVWGLLATEWRFSKWNADRPVTKVTHGQIRPHAPARTRSRRHHRRPIASEHGHRQAAGAAQ